MRFPEKQCLVARVPFLIGSIAFNNSWLNVCFHRQLRQRIDNCGKKKFDVKPLRRFPSLNYFADWLLAKTMVNNVFVVRAFVVIKKRNVIRVLKASSSELSRIKAFFSPVNMMASFSTWLLKSKIEVFKKIKTCKLGGSVLGTQHRRIFSSPTHSLKTQPL